MSRGKNTPVMRRGNRPLAWYIGEKILDKDDTDRETPSPSSRANSVNRKSSMESQASNKPILPSSFPSDIMEDKKKKGGGGGKKNQKQRSKRLSANFSFTSAQEHSNIARDLNSSSDKSHSSTKEKKEDYWYYDPVSDGFYYEHNGSRGWRRRNPKLHGIPAPVKMEEPEQKMLIPPTLPAAAATNNPANKFAINPGVANNSMSTMKYDPNTDGYFYEMASVDGWKRRRQPAAGTSPPSNSQQKPPQQMPQMHQLPPNFSLLPSFLHPSLLSNDTHRLVVPPMPAQDSNSTTPQAHSLSHSELEDMVIMRMRNDPDNGYCGSLKDNSNSSGNLPQESLLHRSKRNTGSDEYPSNASTTSSVSDEMVTPPPPSRHSSLFHTIHRSNQRQMEQSKAMPIEQSKSPSQLDMTPQSQTMVVGSFDEPYEFYWSDTDKPPSVCSVDEKSENVSQDLLSYFNELKIQPNHIESMSFDTFRQRTGSSSMKRPTTLNIQNNNRGQTPDKENANMSNFNVDKFIADLPPFFNDNILGSLYALKTPIGEHPQIADSPLFTPILAKENVWRMPAANGPSSSSKENSSVPPLGRELTNADIGGNPFLFNGLERIWQWPAA